jgi:murein tripeptide amidase MpaA
MGKLLNFCLKITARQKASIEQVRPERAPAIWIDAGIHAREWIGKESFTFSSAFVPKTAHSLTLAPATAMNIIKILIEGYNSADVDVRYLVESLDWYITVVLNPDGYEYSHTKNRMWRKNRRPALCKKVYLNRICCAGVDLNRNFDWHWASE